MCFGESFAFISCSNKHVCVNLKWLPISAANVEERRQMWAEKELFEYHPNVNAAADPCKQEASKQNKIVNRRKMGICARAC